MKPLKEILYEKKPAEFGGETALLGLDYQIIWAITKMLEYDLLGKSFSFIFEYHDDVLILDDSVNPEKAMFCQVKTKNAKWTLPQLINTVNGKKKEKLSILGKLFRHKMDFSEFQLRLSFVTNSQIDFIEGRTSRGEQLSSEIKKRITTAINEQLIDASITDLADLEFEISSLSFEDQSVHLEGRISSYLDLKFNGSSNIKPRIFTQAIERRCREKAKYKSINLRSFEDLIERKGVSNLELSKAVQSANAIVSDSGWANVSTLLTAFGYTPTKLISAEAAFVRVQKLIISQDSVTTKLCESIGAIVDKTKDISDIHSRYLLIMIDLNESNKDSVAAVGILEVDCAIAYYLVQSLQLRVETK